jgi:hypothetical protein
VDFKIPAAYEFKSVAAFHSPAGAGQEQDLPRAFDVEFDIAGGLDYALRTHDGSDSLYDS